MSRTGIILLVIGLCAAVLIGFMAGPKTLAQGWLVALAFWSGLPVGALVLMLVHRVSGGAWGPAFAPVLARTAALVPLVGVAVLLLALDLPATYPWAADPDAAARGVARLYLNSPGFLIRAVVACGGWGILAALAVSGRLSAFAAALGIAFHGVAISFVAVDWMLSVDPHYTSTSFAAGIAVQQILSALALVALVSPATLDETRARDLSGLLLASLLGLVYLDLMAYIVAWYGNLPAKAAWYLRRAEGPWACVLVASVACGGFLPFLLLLSTRVRASRAALRGVGALILLGAALHTVWLLAPAFEAESVLGALASLLVMCGASVLALQFVDHALPSEVSRVG